RAGGHLGAGGGAPGGAPHRGAGDDREPFLRLGPAGGELRRAGGALGRLAARGRRRRGADDAGPDGLRCGWRRGSGVAWTAAALAEPRATGPLGRDDRGEVGLLAGG